MVSGCIKFEVLRFYQPLYFSNAPRGVIFLFYVFTSRSTFPTPFGDSIFRCTAKDRGERRAKGIVIPLNPLGVMVWAILTCFVPTTSQWCV